MLRRSLRLVAAVLLAVAGLAAAGAQPAAATSQPIFGDLALFAPPVPTLTVLSEFRPPASAYGAGHRGVDLRLDEGDPVYAAGSGIVIYAADLAGRGVISIEHSGGLRTTYEPITAVVTARQTVAAGTLIGHVSGSHPVCAPAICLHFGARLPDGIYLDPMLLFRPWQVRLKPWSDG